MQLNVRFISTSFPLTLSLFLSLCLCRIQVVRNSSLPPKHLRVNLEEERLAHSILSLQPWPTSQQFVHRRVRDPEWDNPANTCCFKCLYCGIICYVVTNAFFYWNNDFGCALYFLNVAFMSFFTFLLICLVTFFRFVFLFTLQLCLLYPAIMIFWFQQTCMFKFIC